jgi:alkyl hydroperoxide reductase subunit AhpC
MSKTASVGLRAGKPSAGDKRKGLAMDALTEKNQTVRVNFELDREEHIRLKIHAAKAGKTITDVLRELVATLE